MIEEDFTFLWWGFREKRRLPVYKTNRGMWGEWAPRAAVEIAVPSLSRVPPLISTDGWADAPVIDVATFRRVTMRHKGRDYFVFKQVDGPVLGGPPE